MSGKSTSALRRAFAVAAGLLALVASASAQDAGPGRVVAVDVVRPVYPPIAISARIAGEVTIFIKVRPDGALESADVVAGPSIVREEALKAVRASRFECRDCSGTSATHTMLFSFGFDRPEEATDLHSDLVTHVHITAKSPELRILFATIGVRSIKCLYLWHCGSQWGGMDFYNYRARSGRCAWLWKCGWRRRE